MEEAAIKEESRIEIRQMDGGGVQEGESYYYGKRLGFTGDTEKDINILYEYYCQKISHIHGEEDVKDTLYEYVSLLNTRGLCGTEIVAEKINLVSRKSSIGKKNLGYLIGCLRHVLENGIATTGSSMDRRLISAFENRFDMKLSPDGVTQLLRLSTSISAVEVLFALVENDMSIEEMVLGKFESLIRERREL